MKKSMIAISLALTASAAFAGAHFQITSGMKDAPVTAWFSSDKADVTSITSNIPTTISVNVAKLDLVNNKNDGIFLTCGEKMAIWVAAGSSYICSFGANSQINPGATLSWSDDGSKVNKYGTNGTWFFVSSKK